MRGRIQSETLKNLLTYGVACLVLGNFGEFLREVK
jgi:hypothetical protein